VHAFPGRLRAGAVTHPKENPGDELHADGKRQRAAPHVTPARAARHIFVERLFGQLPHPVAIVEPIKHALHAVGTFSFWPALKFWNATQTSPFRTSACRLSNPRGAGLDGLAIPPSSANVLLWHGQ